MMWSDAAERHRVQKATDRLRAELSTLFEQEGVARCIVRISPYYEADGQLRVILNVSAEQLDCLRRTIRDKPPNAVDTAVSGQP